MSFLADYATFGVTVFFVVSGFLITTLLLREKDKNGSISLRDFYVRRAFRILPPAYFFLLIVTMLEWHSLERGKLLAAWLYCMDFVRSMPWDVAHIWSLSVEEQFYLVWPVALVLFWRQRNRILVLGMVAAPVARILFHAFGLKDISTTAFPCVEDALAAGCLLAIFRDRLRTRLVDALALPIAIVTLTLSRFHWPHGVYPGLVESLQIAGIALLLDHCIRKEYWMLNWKPVVWLGTVSYSLYLWQMPFLNGVDPIRGWWVRYPWNLGCALACACFSYYFIERPALALRDKVIRRMHAKETPALRAVADAKMSEDALSA